jgi:hypothetical protein
MVAEAGHCIEAHHFISECGSAAPLLRAFPYARDLELASADTAGVGASRCLPFRDWRRGLPERPSGHAFMPEGGSGGPIVYRDATTSCSSSLQHT